MAVCPSCGTKVQSPAKVFTVLVEPKEGEKGLMERKVGMYECTRCKTKFPTVVSRQHYLIVAEEQLKQLQADVKSLKKDNGELKKQYDELERALERTKQESEIRMLETKVSGLEEQITYLKKEKGELEQKIAKFV